MSDLGLQEFWWQTALQVNQVKVFGYCRADALNPTRRVHLGFPIAQLKPDQSSRVHKTLADPQEKL